MLKIEKISKSYYSSNQNLSIISDISINAEPGEIISIYGPNGSGKSTLLKIIAGITEPDSGSLKFHKKENKIGFVWQNYTESLFPWYSVERNINLPLQSDKNENISKIIFEELGVDVRLDAFPYQLSGGQQQMVTIARALANDPDLLLLDEPFSALDTKKREQILRNLHKYCKTKKIMVFFVSHSLDEAILFGDKLILLSDIPTFVMDIIEIEFTKERNNNVLTSPKFIEYRNEAIETINRYIQ